MKMNETEIKTEMPEEEQPKEKKNKKKSKGRAGKIILRVFLIILGVIIVFAAVTGVVALVGNNANRKMALSFEKVEYTDKLTPVSDENGDWCFTTDRDFKIMQLTDVHIGAGFMSLKKDANAINAVCTMVREEKPDLVIVTGDIAYPVPFQSGTINNKTSAKMFADMMENLGVYWTMCFGNHDTELYSLYNREQMADFYMNSGYKYCLFQKGPDDVDGFSNHVINVKNSKGIITQSIFIIDSHSYTDGDYFGAMWKYDNIHENQIEWYKNKLTQLNAYNDNLYEELKIKKVNDVKSLMFFHIPPIEEKTAWDEFAANGYKDTENVKLVYGFAGGAGKMVYCGMHEDELFETVQALGSTQGIFFGHDHRNNMCFDYKGVRLTYGMSIDYLAIPGISKIGRQRGCTLINVSPDGSYESHNENYYQDKYISAYEKDTAQMQEITYPYNGE